MVIALFIVIIVALIMVVLFNVKTVQKKKNLTKNQTDSHLKEDVIKVEHGDTEYRQALRSISGVTNKPKIKANVHTAVTDDEKYRDALRSFIKPENKS